MSKLDEYSRLVASIYDGRAVSDSSACGSTAGLFAALADGDGTAVFDGSAVSTRCLLLLLKVAQTVTDELSLDHQLPRLIELIVAGLDAERATLFLHDSETDELFSRVARGEGVTEIRIRSTTGIAGAVYGSEMTEIISDAYQDPRFNQEVDRRTGFRTRNILCVPLRNRLDQTIGVTQVLNKHEGCFTQLDAALLAAVNRLAASALEQAQLVEKLDRARREEEELLAITEAISTELHIDALLTRIVQAATEMLEAERSTLFLYDATTDELYSRVAKGTVEKQIRIPAKAGIAGAVFTSGEMLNVPDSYAHPLFNTEIDRNSGFRTRNLLSVPVIDRAGEHLGVLQVLNKRNGPFAQSDICRLKAFSAEIAVAIQNAQLFSDVLELKNYNESILKSLSNGVVTFDQQLIVAKANEAAYRILGLSPESLLGRSAEQVFGNRNPWVTRSLDYVRRMAATDYHADTDLRLADDSATAVNLTTAPIADLAGKPIGFMTVFEDITREKRVRHTMARYVAKEIIDRLLASGDDLLEGSALVTTVLFADIRRFATLTETMGPRQTVAMLNDYFAEMVEVIVAHNGMLDKYVGDGLMAIFGAPVSGGADADNALWASTGMMSRTSQPEYAPRRGRARAARNRPRARDRRRGRRLARVAKASRIRCGGLQCEPRRAARKRQQILRYIGSARRRDRRQLAYNGRPSQVGPDPGQGHFKSDRSLRVARLSYADNVPPAQRDDCRVRGRSRTLFAARLGFGNPVFR
jgi:adenylate cyclase